MSVRKKPEKAVPVLLDRLTVVESHILANLLEDSDATLLEDSDDVVGKPNSKLTTVKRRLEVMSKSMSRIKEWEKHVVRDLCVLEKALDDAEHKSLDDVRKILGKVEEGVGNLESYISTEEESVTLKDGGMSSSEPETQQHHTPCETVSEWAGLAAEDDIKNCNKMSCLWETIHCPDTKLRMCLLFLSVFPEKTPIKKRPLIYWWMGEGLVSDEEDGENVFQRLLDEGFIDDKEKGRGFTLSPWVRRVLISLAEKTRLFKFSALWQGVRPCNSERRAFLYEGDGVSSTDAHVLTVFNINEKYLVGTKLEWLRGLHHLEVLQLGRWQDSPAHHIEAVDQFLEAALASKRHLRYLSLRGVSRIETLPAAAIRKLVSLRILDLRACHNLETLPRTIAKLRNLTHLDASECYLLEGMPKGIRHLLNLQVLKGFVVGNPGRGFSEISDLGRLKQLRKLSIMVRRQQLGSLENLSESLHILTILWIGDAKSNTSTSNSTSTSTVKLPTSLAKLDLRCVPFQELPEWLHPSKVPKLEKLRIKGGQLRELPVNNNHEYKYPKVKSLRLQCLANLRIEQDHLVCRFPNYLHLEKTNCHKDDQDIIINRSS